MKSRGYGNIRRVLRSLRTGWLVALASFASAPARALTNHTVVAWNNLGMHCMDSDYSVFSILPPYNTINAQIIFGSNGTARLLSGTVYTNTYEPVADPSGSINRSSRGKGNFYDYMGSIFGFTLRVDTGLPGPGPDPWLMPGTNSARRAMGWESGMNWFVAYGIPIFPMDDAGRPNQYPMMRVTAWNAAGRSLASSDIVLPVSDEMDCKLCHLSGSGDAARPAAGWANAADPGRDYRLNILRLHDERQWSNSPSLYASALAAKGFSPAGLYATVTVSNHPFLCAACHLSEALPDMHYPGVIPLTTAVHGRHATVTDPRNGMTLDAAANRTACYSCHPGSVTRCLRGAMGKAVAADGSMEMQCQSCHGPMSEVGKADRTGWFDEPNCQSCHTGNAMNNNGQIRYTSAFANGINGAWRTPATNQFATTPDMPLAGKSLYRFSTGHGGVKCSGCHGSTHAEFPSAHTNDNIASIQHQSHAGVLSECSTCHAGMPNTVSGGPHGLHPIGSHTAWVESGNHVGAYRATNSTCNTCHRNPATGRYTGTVLAYAQADRVYTHDATTFTLWRGQKVGCYECHNGTSGDGSPPARPGANAVSGATPSGVAASFLLSGANALSWRIVSQPQNGSVGITGGVYAVYTPAPGFAGTDTFTYASSSLYRESLLASGTVVVTNSFSAGDGIPDAWKGLHFGCTDCAEAAATADPDFDGANNLQEYNAGTDPNDPRSNVHIFAVSATPTNGVVNFASQLGAHYAVDAADDIASGNWSSLNSNVWGRTDATPVTDTNAAGKSTRFYRVKILP